MLPLEPYISLWHWRFRHLIRFVLSTRKNASLSLSLSPITSISSSLHKLQEFQALDQSQKPKKIAKISRKEEGKERNLSQSGTETSSILLQYTTYLRYTKALQSIDDWITKEAKPAALSHTDSFAVAANAQSKNNNDDDNNGPSTRRAR
jgi:hypothetical protein